MKRRGAYYGMVLRQMEYHGQNEEEMGRLEAAAAFQPERKQGL